jgi:hypothetical protein
LPLVTTSDLSCSKPVHCTWPLPVTRLSDTVYGIGSSGRVQEMVTDVAVSDEVVTTGVGISTCTIIAS